MIYDLENSVGYQLTVLARTNERNIETVLEDFGLNRMTWVTLVAVGANSLSQPSRIADFLGVDRAAVSRALGALADLDLVERLHAEADARRINVQVTRKGASCLAEVAPRVRAANARMVKPLTDDERDQFMRLLMRMNADRSSLLGI